MTEEKVEAALHLMQEAVYEAVGNDTEMTNEVLRRASAAFARLHARTM